MASGRMAIPASCLLVAVVTTELGYLKALASALAFSIYLLWRNRLLAGSLRQVAQGLEPGPALFFTTLGLSGLLGGFALVAFDAIGYELRVLLTLLLCCWCAAAMLSSGFSPRLYGCYLAAISGSLAAAWLRTGTGHGVSVAFALLMYGLVLYAFSFNFSRRIREGIAIRSENAELVRQLAAANEAKTRFLMAASHDLRQPLHAIGLMGAGLVRLKDPEEIKALSGTLVATVENLNQLFSSILDISRLDSGDQHMALGEFSLDGLVAQLDSEYRALCLAGERRWECRVESLAVRSDPVQLERLLRNLLDNALKHGGSGAVRLSVVREGDEAVITVADTGPGIAPKDRERVFDEFYRTGDTGLGLGLSIVRRLVDKLGLALEIGWTDPEHRKGACITLRLQALQQGAAIAAIREPTVDLTGLAVLVLEDDSSIRQATDTLLRSWGCRVQTCGGADELEAAVRQLGEPDVALIDYQLGAAALGTQVIAGTQAAFPGMSTLIVTGESDPARIEQLKDLGFVLSKPLSPANLYRALASIRSARS